MPCVCIIQLRSVYIHCNVQTRQRTEPMLLWCHVYNVHKKDPANYIDTYNYVN